MKSVKNAHSVAAAMAVPPGIQPAHARKRRSSRSDDRPSASRKPATVNSGIAAIPGDVVNCWYAISGRTAGGVPRTSEANSAMPPSSAKIGAPRMPGREHEDEPGQERLAVEDRALIVEEQPGDDAERGDGASGPVRRGAPGEPQRDQPEPDRQREIGDPLRHAVRDDVARLPIALHEDDRAHREDGRDHRADRRRR